MIFTIGHSALSQEEFIARCRHAGIGTIVDVRTHPTSKWKWYTLEELQSPESWLAKSGIGYAWEPGLAGWSSRHSDDPQLGAWAIERGIDLAAYAGPTYPRLHASRRTAGDGSASRNGWANQGMADFVWYTMRDEFQTAAETLYRESQRGHSRPNSGLMCSEFAWWRCHRANIADYLAWKGHVVVHTQPTIAQHTDVIADRMSKYPAEVLESWGPRVTRK